MLQVEPKPIKYISIYYRDRMRSLALVSQEQNVGEFSIHRHGNPKMVNASEGVLNIQKFMMEVPLVTTQEYILNGFDGHVPRITVESEATPVINLPNGKHTDLENVVTKRITTESVVRTENGTTFLTIACRFIMTAQFTVTNTVNIKNVTMEKIEGVETPPPATDQKINPEQEKRALNARSLIELGNLDDHTDVDSVDTEVDMIKENRIPYMTRLHNLNICDGDISHADETDIETDAELLQALYPIDFKHVDNVSDVDSAYGTVDGSLNGSYAISRAVSDFESINLDFSDTDTEGNNSLFSFDWSDNDEMYLPGSQHKSL